METENVPVCPYCGKLMKKWKTPEASTWNSKYQYICFNDECSYFVKGWEWMHDKYNVKASYRHRLDPKTGEKGPIPVWSYDALKNDIVE